MEKRGRFYVSHDFKHTGNVIDALFEWLEFTPVSTIEHADFTEYIGLSEQFEECPPHQTPLYNMTGGWDEVTGKWFEAERVTG